MAGKHRIGRDSVLFFAGLCISAGSLRPRIGAANSIQGSRSDARREGSAEDERFADWLCAIPGAVLAAWPLWMWGLGRGELSVMSLVALLVFAPLAAIWGSLRMLGRVRRLANRGTREELALAFLRPESLIEARMRPPLIRASFPLLLSALTPAFTFVVLVAGQGLPPPDEFLVVFAVAMVLLAEIACCACTMYGATFDLLARLCAPKPSQYVLGIGTMLWAAWMILVPVAFYTATMWSVFAFLAGDGPVGLILSAIAAWGCVAASAFVARRRWRTAHERLFKFE